jgi:hypothetical protein
VTRYSVFPLLATLVLLPACTNGTPEPDAAELTISVSPVPLIVRWACPVHAPTDPPPTQCFLSMDPLVSIKESAGVGGRIVSVDLSVRDAATNAQVIGVTLDRNWVLTNAGTDRVDANTTLAFRVVVNNYPLPFAPRPNFLLDINARVVDDKGNELTPNLRINIS